MSRMIIHISHDNRTSQKHSANKISYKTHNTFCEYSDNFWSYCVSPKFVNDRRRKYRRGSSSAIVTNLQHPRVILEFAPWIDRAR